MFCRARSFAVVVVVALLTAALPVPDARASGLSIQVTAWQVDHGTGALTYDVTVSGTCGVSRCSWLLDGWYSDGAGDQFQRGIATGTASNSYGSQTPFSTRLTGTLQGSAAPEITHLKARMELSAGGWVTTGLHSVSAPYPAPWLALSVHKWRVDPGTGSVDYDVTMNGGGFGQRFGPCDAIRCNWGIEAYHDDGTTRRLEHVLLSYSNSGSRKWTVSERSAITGFAARRVTHLRAYVRPHSCAVPCAYETVDTGFRFVGDHTERDHDLVPYSTSLTAAYAANRSTFCDGLALRGGPSVDGDSVPDVYQRCAVLVMAGTAISVLLAELLATPGGRDALDDLLEDWVTEPVPSSEEQEDPPLPWFPPDDWTDNGCKQFISDSSIESAANKIESFHVLGANQGRSEFFVDVDWRWLASFDAKRVPAQPSAWTGSKYCVRRVEYWRDVGIERRHNFSIGPTHVYTVLTNKDTGALFNMYPGETAEMWNQ